MTEQKPSVGRVVHYTFGEPDAAAVNLRRSHAAAHMANHRERSDGSQVHFGNNVAAGDVYPMVITRVWGDSPTSAVNGQVLLDGNDTYWATSITVGDAAQHFSWPPKV